MSKTTKNRAVGLVRAETYDPKLICQWADELFSAVGFSPSRGDLVVLKPNLVAPSMLNDLACTHPQFVEGVARWFVDHGCRVRVGDSPASGSCANAMEKLGLDMVVQKLGLEIAPFQQTVSIPLNCGVTVPVCRDALECDHLVNLPKVKSHALVRVTLAVKNHFGMVKGWRKAMAHQVHGGGCAITFIDMLCDLPGVVPQSISLCDGITAMHVTGPMGGKPYDLHLMGCCPSPVALDTALLAALGVTPESSPIQSRFVQRGEVGSTLADVCFPLCTPDDFDHQGFIVPSQLGSIRFDLGHVLQSVLKRLQLWLRGVLRS